MNDSGAGHAPYFGKLQALLRREGLMRPLILIDLDRLDHNLDVVLRSLRRGTPSKSLRLVDKSLPAPGLLRYLRERAATPRLMSFHEPFLRQDTEHFPDADVLLGKPLPVAAAARFYRERRGPFDPARQLQWLIDTPQRLAQYLELARSLGTRLRVNVEIDIGLHRGGLRQASGLAPLMDLIAGNPDHLEFAGLMGYEPHVARLPAIFGRADALLESAMGRYARFVEAARATPLWRGDLTLNTAGSTTYRLHERSATANELSIGTALLKPSHFDVKTLADHLPAVFIATPVLKSTGALRLPGLDRWPLRMPWKAARTTHFLYGGGWMADCVSPPGLKRSALYGHSSNQDMVTAPADASLAPDDLVFLRPQHTESVLLQFGDLIAVRGRRVEAQWPVLSG